MPSDQNSALHDQRIRCIYFFVESLRFELYSHWERAAVCCSTTLSDSWRISTICQLEQGRISRWSSKALRMLPLPLASFRSNVATVISDPFLVRQERSACVLEMSCSWMMRCPCSTGARDGNNVAARRPYRPAWSACDHSDRAVHDGGNCPDLGDPQPSRGDRHRRREPGIPGGARRTDVFEACRAVADAFVGVGEDQRPRRDLQGWRWGGPRTAAWCEVLREAAGRAGR